MTTIDHSHIRLGNVFNFRDLGGYPTIDGREVRRGIVYRSDGLHQADEADLATLGAVGLRTVVDLRTAEEQRRWGVAATEQLGAELLHLPFLSELWPIEGVDDATDPVAYLIARYQEMTEVGDRVLPHVIRLIAHESHRVPVVFHCAAGKDRTGVTAAMLLALAGVDHVTIAEDYARTAQAMVELLAWVAERHPDQSNSMVHHPPAFVSCPPAAMQGFLDQLDERYGSAEGYVRTLGITDDDLRAFRTAFVA